MNSSRSLLYVERLLEEIDQAPQEYLSHARTIYIGGGTPSQLPIEALQTLVAGLRSRIDLSQIEEFTIEANPDDVTEAWVQALPKEIGRVSMGVQSFVDSELQILRRRHDAQTARQAVARLRTAGIGNLSIDLMYGLPGQTLESFGQSIDQAIALGTQHLSAYNLSIEEGTPLATLVNRGEWTPADDELCLAMNQLLRQKLQEAGFVQYEISNYAKPGYESRHNSSYWTGEPYLGLGPGAHSYDGHRHRWWNEPDLNQYLKGQNRRGEEHLTDEDLYNEQIMLGLRTRRGVDLDIVRSHPENRRTVESLLERRLVLVEEGRIRLTPEGLALGDEVMRDLFV